MRACETEYLDNSCNHLCLDISARIYGGLYRGGYVTMLTAASCLFGDFLGSRRFDQINQGFRSLVATIIFMQQGLIDYKIGLILAVVMSSGHTSARTSSKIK